MSDPEIREFASQSVDGHHSGEPVIRSVFRARLPEAEWLRERLPFAHTSENGDLILFTAHTSGVSALARLLVSLGGAVTIETPELRSVAAQLALAALETHR